MRRRVQIAAVLIAAAVGATALSACGDSGSDDEVVLLTHDSFALPDELLSSFEDQTGLTLKVVKESDAGQLSSSIALTAGSPRGDVVYGIDNTFASRVLDADALEPYTSPDNGLGSNEHALPEPNRLTAVDRGDVCVNVDSDWFAQRGQQPPQNFADLADPRYKGLTVVLDPATSSPGMAFLLATIAAYPSSTAGGWQGYWQRLRDNEVAVAPGWSEAYNQEFTAGEGKGSKPVVVSYASSPAYLPTTKALLNTCFEQTEYAGVLRGAENVEGGQKVVDFLLSEPVQAALPESMYVYPVRTGTPLPAEWAQYAPEPEFVASMPAGVIAENREAWQQEWRTVMGR
ncbi:thiamine ABC transporter substrate-binding protein [Gordonia rubripertincta]|uniref:Thiamine ABC transporter substrate-binding protein n=1 Tax=Gordonia rubripertincta TaxID=36822 RepID=A0ABT4MSI2_GORRU|nr:thiamine ABC transporter substrate-binding protein [Gordonia rubripertincta]MCZ4548692.1 thiamine ABC transporter substrate-binding protein [Gordonia rubripertincta]